LVPDTISREIGIDAPPAVVWPIVTEARHPPHTFAFRWLRREGNEPVEGSSTLVVITLIPEGAGTRLRVVESGFSDLASPGER
jgi:uncharacterized protein YndB with AHSA1/START domain